MFFQYLVVVKMSWILSNLKEFLARPGSRSAPSSASTALGRRNNSKTGAAGTYRESCTVVFNGGGGGGYGFIFCFHTIISFTNNYL